MILRIFIYFFFYVDLLCDNQKAEQEDGSFVQGCLICIRLILPYINEDLHGAEKSCLISTDNLLQVNDS